MRTIIFIFVQTDFKEDDEDDCHSLCFKEDDAHDEIKECQKYFFTFLKEFFRDQDRQIS